MIVSKRPSCVSLSCLCCIVCVETKLQVRPVPYLASVPSLSSDTLSPLRFHLIHQSINILVTRFWCSLHPVSLDLHRSIHFAALDPDSPTSITSQTVRITITDHHHTCSLQLQPRLQGPDCTRTCSTCFPRLPARHCILERSG